MAVLQPETHFVVKVIDALYDTVEEVHGPLSRRSAEELAVNLATHRPWDTGSRRRHFNVIVDPFVEGKDEYEEEPMILREMRTMLTGEKEQ